MSIQIKRTTAWLALCLLSVSLSPAGVRAELGTVVTPAAQLGVGIAGRPSALEYAKARAINGQVMKALPSSQNKAMLGAPSPCKKDDLLPDGSVVQTGAPPTSWAELAWGNGKVTRIWADSMVRIFCGRSPRLDTVCLAKGALIFKKDVADPNYYFVETKLLQARIHGTTVRVQSLPPQGGNEGIDKFLVLETNKDKNYSVQVKNKETGSIVDLKPGVELVVKVRASYKSGDQRFEFPALISPAEKPPSTSMVPDYRLNPNRGELLFEDRTSSVSAYTANSKAILEDPMVKGSTGLSPIESIDLIKEAMLNLPTSDNAIGNMINDVINFRHPDRVITDNLKIARVPDYNYSIGPNVGQRHEFKRIQLPRTDHHPVARLGYDLSKTKVAASPHYSAPAGILMPIVPAPAEEETILQASPDGEQIVLKHEAIETDQFN